MSYVNNLQNMYFRRTVKVPFGGPKRLKDTINMQNYILVVEDDEAVLSVLQIIKDKHRLRMDFARTSGEALSLISRKAYDAIILDWNLPDFNGDSFVKLSDQYYSIHCSKHNYERKVKVNVSTFTTEKKRKAKIETSNYFNHCSHWIKPLSFDALEKKVLELSELAPERIAPTNQNF